jgi:undecaprenyl diphosphate synthase
MNDQVPKSLAIIMDGNRRYARERGLATIEGHKAGYEKLKEVLPWVRDAGITDLIVYAFSTENWKRAPEEIEGLMGLARLLAQDFGSRANQGARIRFVGDVGAFPEDIAALMRRIERDTADSGPLTLAIAASYGGRAEIVRAARALVSGGIEITEASLARVLDTQGMMDPDIIIRTGGEQRLSNFLLWQSAYSELFFLDVLWPAFRREDLDAVLAGYAARKRNFGV